MKTVRFLSLAALLVVGGFLYAQDLKPDDEGFIRNWLVLAPIPFEGGGADALNKQQVKDEAKLQPKEGDKVTAAGKELVWKAHKSDDHQLDFNKILGQITEDCVGYGVCYIVADKEIKDVTMKAGTDDQGKAYLNGKEVYKCEDARPLEKDQDFTNGLTFQKGTNTLVVKIVNEKMDWISCFRFVDKDGKPIQGLKVSLKP